MKAKVTIRLVTDIELELDVDGERQSERDMELYGERVWTVFDKQDAQYKVQEYINKHYKDADFEILDIEEI